MEYKVIKQYENDILNKLRKVSDVVSKSLCHLSYFSDLCFIYHTLQKKVNFFYKSIVSLKGKVFIDRISFDNIQDIMEDFYEKY